MTQRKEFKKHPRIAILQHEGDTPPGTSLSWCWERSLSVTVFQAWKFAFPSPMDFDVLFVLGGSANVDDEVKHPWLTKEKDFLQDCLRQDKKVLGLCLGAQLMAEALGAQVQKSLHDEIGWSCVQIDPTAHPLLEFSPSILQTFQWHGYQFEIPSGAVRFGTNEACVNQAFICGTQIIGIQFHPEADENWIRSCANDNEEPRLAGPFIQSSREILESMDKQKPLQSWFYSLLDHWLLL